MSWFSKLNPVPLFPPYSGPYQVGSVDVEIPATELQSPSFTPDSSPATVSFRIFYPCEPTPDARPVRWVPSPQRGWVSAYARFLGARSMFSELFALLPQILYWVTIPVHRNAPLLRPSTPSERWPVMFFSHGLGGSRNAYSHIAGSLASHGLVVIAPEHRDGSAPISYVRATKDTPAHTVEYRNLPHKPSPEVYEARDAQLMIRLYELGLIHDAVLKIDKGAPVTNLDPNSSSRQKHDTVDVLTRFKDQLDVHKPGAITFAGHSFGAATCYQLVKSVFWRPSAAIDGYRPLFTPSPSSALAQQITPHTPVILLDIWCLPMQSPSTNWLHHKPLPCYSPSGPGGTVVLAILSEEFVKWTVHLAETKRLLSPGPNSRSQPGPRFFYPLHSAHLSQSDFGVLFPWLVRRVLKVQDPARTMRLNVRAVLQVLRENGVMVARTSALDLEEEGVEEVEAAVAEGDRGDWRILDAQGRVRGWVALGVDVEMEGTSSSAASSASSAPSSKDAVLVEGDSKVLGEVQR